MSGSHLVIRSRPAKAVSLKAFIMKSSVYMSDLKIGNESKTQTLKTSRSELTWIRVPWTCPLLCQHDPKPMSKDPEMGQLTQNRSLKSTFFFSTTFRVSLTRKWVRRPGIQNRNQF